MKHEPRCIYPVTCTCVSILREREFVMQTAFNLKEVHISDLEKKIESLEKKIEDGLSCCCSGCTKHNESLTNSQSAPLSSRPEDTFPL